MLKKFYRTAIIKKNRLWIFGVSFFILTLWRRVIIVTSLSYFNVKQPKTLSHEKIISTLLYMGIATDAALVGRLAMSHQGRWPASDTQDNLKHKIGECIWWLAVLADRMDISLEEAVAQFLLDTHKGLSQE